MKSNRRFGAGGMGEVYRARDTRLGRTVAIKVIPRHLSEDPVSRRRFEREAQAISALQHPNICTLYDIGHQDGTDYLVMEYLGARPWCAKTRRRRLAKGKTAVLSAAPDPSILAVDEVLPRSRSRLTPGQGC